MPKPRHLRSAAIILALGCVPKIERLADQKASTVLSFTPDVGIAGQTVLTVSGNQTDRVTIVIGAQTLVATGSPPTVQLPTASELPTGTYAAQISEKGQTAYSQSLTVLGGSPTLASASSATAAAPTASPVTGSRFRGPTSIRAVRGTTSSRSPPEIRCSLAKS